MKPNYLVIGASKCGTSSLCTLMREHPNVFMSNPKEPNFFCYDHVYRKGTEWYESFFNEGVGYQAVGEGTSQYSQRTVWPETAGRIAKYLPDAKIIYIVRHPMDRMESLWYQMLEMKYRIPFDFNKALLADVPRFIDSSNYLQEIDVYRKYYSDDRILVLFFEEFKNDPHGVLARCYKFLGVDDGYRHGDADRRRNISSEKLVEAPLLKKLRRTGGYDYFARCVPSWFKSWALEKARVNAPDRPRWDDKTRDWVIEQIGDDTKRFLKRYGKDESYWELASWGRNRELQSVI